MQNQSKHNITFDTQLKTALLYVISAPLFKQLCIATLHLFNIVIPFYHLVTSQT